MKNQVLWKDCFAILCIQVDFSNGLPPRFLMIRKTGYTRMNSFGCASGRIKIPHS